jgi:hypothetical protein
MPLHTHHPPTRVVALHPLDHAVVGARVDANRVAEAIDGLVVDGVYGERLRTEDRCEARRGIDAHAVHAGISLVVHLVRRNVLALGRQILHERSAQSDIDDLNAAADREGRHAERVSPGEQGKLGVVTGAVDRSKLRVRRRSVPRRVDVLATRQYESSNDIENPERGVGVVERRHDDGHEPDRFECVHVRRIQSNALNALDKARGCRDGDDGRSRDAA